MNSGYPFPPFFFSVLDRSFSGGRIIQPLSFNYVYFVNLLLLITLIPNNDDIVNDHIKTQGSYSKVFAPHTREVIENLWNSFVSSFVLWFVREEIEKLHRRNSRLPKGKSLKFWNTQSRWTGQVRSSFVSFI